MLFFLEFVTATVFKSFDIKMGRERVPPPFFTFSSCLCNEDRAHYLAVGPALLSPIHPRKVAVDEVEYVPLRLYGF